MLAPFFHNTILITRQVPYSKSYNERHFRTLAHSTLHSHKIIALRTHKMAPHNSGRMLPPPRPKPSRPPKIKLVINPRARQAYDQNMATNSGYDSSQSDSSSSMQDIESAVALPTNSPRVLSGEFQYVHQVGSVWQFQAEYASNQVVEDGSSQSSLKRKTDSSPVHDSTSNSTDVQSKSITLICP